MRDRRSGARGPRRRLTLFAALLLSLLADTLFAGPVDPFSTVEINPPASASRGATAPGQARAPGEGKHALINERRLTGANVSSRRKLLKLTDANPSPAMAPAAPAIVVRPRAADFTPPAITLPDHGRCVRSYLPQGPPAA